MGRCTSKSALLLKYARLNHYDVVAVFSEVGSGIEVERPGIQSMLAFLDKQRPERYAVIIDEVTRLARGVGALEVLRAAIADAGGILLFCDSESERFAVYHRVPPEELPADANTLLSQQQQMANDAFARGLKVVSAFHDDIKKSTEQ